MLMISKTLVRVILYTIRGKCFVHISRWKILHFGRYLWWDQNTIKNVFETSQACLAHMIPVAVEYVLDRGASWSDMITTGSAIHACKCDMRDCMLPRVERCCELIWDSNDFSEMSHVRASTITNWHKNYAQKGKYLQLLDGARTCRRGLQQACNSFAGEVSKWNKNCDLLVE